MFYNRITLQMIKKVLNSMKRIYSGNIDTPINRNSNTNSKNQRINNIVNMLEDEEEIQQTTAKKYDELKQKHQKSDILDYQYDEFAIKSNTKTESFIKMKGEAQIDKEQTEEKVEQE